jgi:hypothetical protein
MKKTVTFLSALAVASLGGCSRGRDIDFRHLTDAELVRQSPVILVGKVQKLQWFTHERVRHGEENGIALYWFPIDVGVSVENVLRGGVNTSSVTYTYWIGDRGTSGEWNSLMEGARYVHFLRRVHGEFRALVDFWPSAIRVTTGHHATISNNPDMRERIARLVLEPGDDFDPQRFNGPRALRDGERLVGLQAAVELAKKSDLIRPQVCEYLRTDPDSAALCTH